MQACEGGGGIPGCAALTVHPPPELAVEAANAATAQQMLTGTDTRKLWLGGGSPPCMLPHLLLSLCQLSIVQQPRLQGAVKVGADAGGNLCTQQAGFNWQSAG